MGRGRGREAANWKTVVPTQGGGYDTIKRGLEPDEERKQEIIDNTKFYKCLHCGCDNLSVRDFYTIRADGIFAGNDHLVPICKKCVDEMLDKEKLPHGLSMAIFNMCAVLQVPYMPHIIKEVKAKGNGHFDMATYITAVTAPRLEGGDNSRTFASTAWDLIKTGTRVDRIEKEGKGTAAMSQAQIAARDTVISVMGTDPFSAYAKRDRTFLYGEMIKYFDDRIADDPYKLSQIAQIVLNNLQIHRYDMLLVDLDPINDTQKIVDINKIKSMLVQSNDKIAKENEISVRNRSDKEAGKGTLSALMKKLNEQGFAEAEANYYDQLLGQGTQWAINESFKALQQNSFFDENDKQEIFLTQKKLIEDLQKQVDKVTEENRRLRVAIGERREMRNALKG